MNNLIKKVEDLAKCLEEIRKDDYHMLQEMYKQNYKLVKENQMLKKKISQKEFDEMVGKEANKEFKDMSTPGHQAMAIVADIVSKLKKKFIIK